MIQTVVKTPESHPAHRTIGRTFHAWDGHQYYCDSWESGRGYWMTRVDAQSELRDDTPSKFRRNVSERAIGRNFHLVTGQSSTQTRH
ncbi:hypothetical protein OKW11_005948 [Pseudomonas baetica]|nr:hypothetical protein [Pseudomonas baetica]